jgi:hypothetical protein
MKNKDKTTDVIAVRLPYEMVKTLRLQSKTTKHSQGSIVETALKEYFNPEKENNNLAMISRRLLSLDRKLSDYNNISKVNFEALTTFFVTWLVHNPELSEDNKQRVMPQVNKRYQDFLEAINSNITTQTTSLENILNKEKIAKAEDFVNLSQGNKNEQQG